ncbi:MAG: SWIM zinc finger family protein [Cyanobacteria bacterium J06635_10]
MSATWTQEQIVALAPDASSAKNGKALATSSKWSSLGYNEKAVWGEVQGSGKNPYQTQIDLSEPAFKCSCPSRKKPCKHGIVLFLLLISEPKLFTQNIPPESVND